MLAKGIHTRYMFTAITFGLLGNLCSKYFSSRSHVHIHRVHVGFGKQGHIDAHSLTHNHSLSLSFSLTGLTYVTT